MLCIKFLSRIDKWLNSAPYSQQMAFTAQYIFIKHRNQVDKENIQSLNQVGNTGSPHEITAGEICRGQADNCT